MKRTMTSGIDFLNAESYPILVTKSRDLRGRFFFLSHAQRSLCTKSSANLMLWRSGNVERRRKMKREDINNGRGWLCFAFGRRFGKYGYYSQSGWELAVFLFPECR